MHICLANSELRLLNRLIKLPNTSSPVHRLVFAPLLYLPSFRLFHPISRVQALENKSDF